MQFNNDLLAQISNGTIDPNWVMVCLMAVVSFLLIRILNKMDKKLDAHDAKLEDHEVRISVMEKD
jgi:energy-converting hydrogenase Eha subunit H